MNIAHEQCSAKSPALPIKYIDFIVLTGQKDNKMQFFPVRNMKNQKKMKQFSQNNEAKQGQCNFYKIVNGKKFLSITSNIRVN